MFNAAQQQSDSVNSQQLAAANKSNFAVPAPPMLSAGEKVRRLSDSEHFRQPNVTVGSNCSAATSHVQKQLQEAQTQAQAQALADMILKV